MPEPKCLKIFFQVLLTIHSQINSWKCVLTISTLKFFSLYRLTAWHNPYLCQPHTPYIVVFCPEMFNTTQIFSVNR